jgi:hypothetical protein
LCYSRTTTLKLLARIFLIALPVTWRAMTSSGWPARPGWCERHGICRPPPYIFGQVGYPQPDGTICIDIYGAPRRVIDGIQALDGLFIAAHRSVVSSISFDAATYDGFHLYDIDFSYRAYQAGLRLAVANDICLLHHPRGRDNIEQSLYKAAWKRDKESFEQRFGGPYSSMELRRFTPAQVLVKTREEAMEVMTPPYW